jgi:hypothetical protein
LGVSKFWKREHDPLERSLRAARPEARDELVAELVSRSATGRPVHRRSRGAFAAALTVFMVGSFASFGGLGYAAASAQDAAKSLTRIVTPSKQTALQARDTQSSAQHQYGKDTFTPPAAKPKSTVTIKVASASATQVAAESGELPFTGLGLGATALLGLALLGFGAMLRRRENRRI